MQIASLTLEEVALVVPGLPEAAAAAAAAAACRLAAAMLPWRKRGTPEKARRLEASLSAAI